MRLIECSPPRVNTPVTRAVAKVVADLTNRLVGLVGLKAANTITCWQGTTKAGDTANAAPNKPSLKESRREEVRSRFEFTQ